MAITRQARLEYAIKLMATVRIDRHRQIERIRFVAKIAGEICSHPAKSIAAQDAPAVLRSSLLDRSPSWATFCRLLHVRPHEYFPAASSPAGPMLFRQSVSDGVSEMGAPILFKSYTALPHHRQVLGTAELHLLKQADGIYSSKGFEYFNPEHALRGYLQHTNLAALDAVARQLLAP